MSVCSHFEPARPALPAVLSEPFLQVSMHSLGGGPSSASAACSSAGPWDAYTGASGASAGPATDSAASGVHAGDAGREDPVWKISENSSRLQFLAALPPANAPPNATMRIGVPEEFLKAMRQYAINATTLSSCTSAGTFGTPSLWTEKFLNGCT